jgi:hypothetical protein
MAANGIRSGWNARGGTVNDHLLIDQETAHQARMEADPDSATWEARAQIELDNLTTILGDSDLETWISLNNLERRTWKEIYHVAVNFDDHELDCACQPGYVCPACQARARLSAVPY